MSDKKVYLGDSVYVDIEYGMVKLTTENGAVGRNVILLEPEVLDNFLKFLEDEPTCRKSMEKLYWLMEEMQT